MRVTFGVAALAVVLFGCDWSQKPDPVARHDAANDRLDQIKRACTSKLTYARLKEYMFDEAARIGRSDSRLLDPIAAGSVVRMDNPVVKSRDDDLNITVCAGQFVLNLPPGVQDAFGGKPVIAADVEYAAQEAVDGSGLVYSMTGAEPIIYRLATLGWRQQRQNPSTAPIAEPIPQTPIAAKDSSDEAPTSTRGPRKPDRTSPPETKKKAPVSLDALSAKATASPSFNCRNAKTRSEKMVCRSSSLAAADRRMSAVYYSEMAEADGATKRALRRTRDEFLARRDRCSDQSCVAQVYRERVAEISRISGH